MGDCGLPPKTGPIAKRVKRHGLLRALGGRRAAQGTARPFMVAVVVPVVHDAPDVGEAHEPVALRQLSRNLPSKLSTKALMVGLPGWMKSGVAPDRPPQKRIALLADSEPLSQTTALGALPSSSRKSASRAPETGVATGWPDHEAGRPALVRPGRRGHPDPPPGGAMRPLAPLGSDLQAKPRVGAASALAGRHQAFALQHAGRRQVAVAGMPTGQLAQAIRQRPVAAPRLRTAPGRRAVEPQQAADPPFAGRVGLPETARRLPLGGGRQRFSGISMRSSSIRMSRLRSATLALQA